MGKARRHGIPFYKDNHKIQTARIKSKVISRPPEVQESRDIRITDKTISFVAPMIDCCVQKVVKEYVPYFEQEGYHTIFTSQNAMPEIIKYTPKWVVLLRVATNVGFNEEIGLPNTLKTIAHLRRLGVRVVYYIDDLLINMNRGAPVEIAAACDAVIVATTELKSLFKSMQGISVPIIHIPTHMDLPVFDFLSKNDDLMSIKRFKVLLSSSGRLGATYLHNMCEKAEARWQEFDDVQWIINANHVLEMRTIINSFRNLHKTYFDWLALEAYYSLCKSVDLIINPAHADDLMNFVPAKWQDVWMNSKSAVKFTIAGAARIPIISSPMKSYVEAIQDGETGFIANSEDEFLDKILYLKNNPDVRKQVGEKARIAVEENFDIRKRYKDYRDAIIGAYEETDTSLGILTSPPSDGGPGSFLRLLGRHIPEITSNKYKLVTHDSSYVKSILSVAFLQHHAMRAAKQRDPSIKFVQRMDGLPYVSYLGDDSGQQPGEIQQSVLEVMQTNYEVADFIVWQSHWIKDQWQPYVDVNGKPSAVIYNGIDTTMFNTSGMVMPLPGEQTKLFINSWSIFPHKRMDLAIEIAKQYPNIDFHIVGHYKSLDPTKNFEIFAQIPNITYYGPVHERQQLVNLYRSVDALLFLSEHEGCSNTCLEAAACGCPIIYNMKCGVVPEMFGKDLLLGFNAIEDLDHILNIQLNDIEFIQSLRNGLLDKVQDFTAIKMTEKYLEILIGN